VSVAESPVGPVLVADPLPEPPERLPAAPAPVRRLWTWLAVAAALRVAILPHGGFPSDIASFKAWAATLAEHGPRGFYGRGFADYLPGYLYVLWGVGELTAALRLNDAAALFLLKLPAALADLIGAAVVLRLARRFLPEAGAVTVAVLYLLHPALLFTTAYWGQADSVGGLLAVATLGLALGDHPLAWGAAALAVLVKPQTAPLLGVLGVLLLRRTLWPPERPPAFRPQPGPVAAALPLLLATAALVAAPFGVGLLGLLHLLRRAAEVYPYGSVMAFNLWGAVQGFWQSDLTPVAGWPPLLWGIALTAVAQAAVLWTVWRRPDERTVVTGAATALAAAFLLPTRIHERYLVPALPFLLAAGATDRRVRLPVGLLSLVLTLNLLYAYTRPYLQTVTLPGWLEATLFSPPATRVLSALAVATLPLLLRALVLPPRS